VPITPAPAPPFVGRTKEIEALWGAFEEAVKGRPAAIFVHGSSGIGKTALVGHFLSSLRARRPSVILAGRCYERESLPFKAFDSVIDVLCAHLRARASSGEQAPLPEDIHDLARLFPALLEIPGIHDVAPRSAFRASPLEARARAFRALKALFSTVAARGPLVLHVDDLQWGDRDSALLLLEILGPPAPPPIFVLGTYRSEDALASEFLRVIFGEDLRDGAGSAVVRTIKLEPLAEAEAEELALALLDGSELSRDTASRVAREAKGSPFFVTELAQSLRMEAWTAQVDATSAEATVERLLIARIERLPSDARRILEIVAVAGQPIEQGAALRAAKLHGEGPPALAALRSGHLVRTRGAGPTDAVEVYHDRVRQVALSQIPKERRSLRHLCLARALELTGRAEAETLATHFREGGDRESAGRYALEAAEQAMGSLAFDNAARLYRIALDQGSIGQASARDLLSKLGAALVSAGRNTEAAEAFLQASAGAPALLALDFKRKAATLFLLSGRADKGIPVLREVLAGVGLTYPATPRRAFASLLFNRARLAIRGRRFEERDEASIDPVSLSTIDICHGAFTGLAAVDPIRCAGFLSRYLLLALAAGEPRRIAVGLAWDALYGLFVGGSARAEEALAAASSLADRLEDANARGLVILVRAMKSWGEGTWAEAVGLAGEAERALFSRGEGSAWAMATAQVVQGSCLLALGDLKALAARLPVWLRAAADRGDRYAMISLRTNAGAASVLALAAGDPAGARAELERAMALWTREGFDMQHLGALKSGVLVDLYEGDGSGARARVAAAWPALEGSMLLRGKLARIWALMLRAGAALGAASSAGEGRKRLLSEAERDARRLASEADGEAPMIGASASAALIRASAAALAGDGPRARSLLESAIEGFEVASMQLDAAAARRRLGELVGGEEGRAIREGADAWMAAQGVLRPERLTAALAPGFESENK
jgi:tetratricopeptide (TPR) repeat protein